MKDITTRANYIDGDLLHFSEDGDGYYRDESRTTYDEYEIKYTSTFEGLPRKSNDIDDLFYQYHEWAKDNGFKLAKSMKKIVSRGLPVWDG